MPSFNKIILVGHLGRDPELKYTPQGTAVANFSIATTERRKGGGGDAQEVTTWFRVTLFGKQAEVAQQYLNKGKLVYVEGRLKLNEYTDREGKPRTSLEVTADNFQMLGGNPAGEAQGERNEQHGAAMNAQAPSRQTASRPQQPAPSFVADDSDIPF